MGTRIHKAIGWGLKAAVFAENIGFEIEDDDLHETLYGKLKSITELIVPERSVAKIFDDWRGFIAEPNLLATTFTSHEPCTSFLPSASDLHIDVANYDEPTDVHLFLPSGINRGLYRYDNTLDYIECTHDLTTGKYARDPSSFLCVELQQNPHPWNNDWMDKGGAIAGVGVVWDFERERLGLVPRPPAEIRWWLTETGILKPDAWKLLRPYYASWWG